MGVTEIASASATAVQVVPIPESCKCCRACSWICWCADWKPAKSASWGLAGTVPIDLPHSFYSQMTSFFSTFVAAHTVRNNCEPSFAQEFLDHYQVPSSRSSPHYSRVAGQHR